MKGKGKISKLENNFLTYHDSNNLLLQPENLYTVSGVPSEQQTTGHYRVDVRIENLFQSIFCYIWID